MSEKVELVWVFVVDYAKGWGVRKHSHDYFQMYYCLAGESPVFLEDQDIHLAPNDCLLIHPNQIHEVKPLPNGYLRILDTKFYVHDEELYRSLIKMPAHINIASPTFSWLQKETRNEWASGAPYCYEMATLIFEQLLYLYLREMNCSPAEVPFYHEMEQKIASLTGIEKEIANYILENFLVEISLDQLAQDLRYSKNYLCKVFKEATGYTIIEYRNMLRIRKAYDMVRYTSQTLSDISSSCGFSSIHYFSRVFHRYAGISPSQARDQDRNSLNMDMRTHGRFRYRYFSPDN